ncbi:MAG TPA: hypothetical protein VFQ85_17665 [Mycobacteriales bacterium]|nr:hypothetical protein [Mycobacteriales bacterium]
MKIAKGAAIAVGFTAALGVAVPGFAGGNKYASQSITADCGDGDVVAFAGPTTLWPPNHKFVAEKVSATDADGGNVTIEIDPVVTDAVGGDGGATHDPDFTYTSGPAATGAGTAAVDFALRSERSGRGDGRTYTINWKATFDNGSKTCTSDDDGQDPFVVSVPHDMRDKNN